MKCPKCLREINDEASFCGYCGQVIEKESRRDIPAEDPVNTETQISQETQANTETQISQETQANTETQTSQDTPVAPVEEPKSEPAPKKRKKHIGRRVLLAFSIVAIIAGALLGLLTAKGVIDLSNVIPSNRFEWTDFSEALDTDSESTTPEDKSDDKEETKASEETNASEATETTETTETTEATEATEANEEENSAEEQAPTTAN